MIKTIETSSTWNGGEITRDMYTELQQSMVESAERIATRAKSLVPVGDLSEHPAKANQNRHLRDTIRARGRRKKSGLEVIAERLARGDYEMALPGAWVFAGDRRDHVYWHHWVEFGTYDSPAHPYMRPAVDENFNATVAEAARAGQRAINKRRRGVARRRRERGQS